MATQVEFHTGVADGVQFACRLLRKAYHQGARLVVRAPAATLGVLDRALWTFEAHEFVPHLRLQGGVPAPALQRTPIWLSDEEPPPDGPPILINLAAPAPADPARFARVIEVVSTDPAEVQAARQRWRGYEALGLAVRHHAARGGG